MNRLERLVLGALATAIILGSSLVVASEPADDDTRRRGPSVGGGLGHNLKK